MTISTARLTRIVPILEVEPGSSAVVREVRDQHSRAVLRSLGLYDGALLRVCRLGDPCIIQVRSTRIGLSKAVAHAIHVELASGAER